MLAVRPPAQMDRTTFGGDLAGDALAQGNTDLGPELGLDAAGDADAQRVGLGIEEHQAAPLGAGHADGDLEHALEELVGLDRELNGLDDLVECLEQLGLAIAGGDAVAPEKPGRQRGHELRGGQRPGTNMGGGIARCIDDGVVFLLAEEGGCIVDEKGGHVIRECGAEAPRSFEGAGDVRVVDPRDLDAGIGEQQAQ